MTQTARIAAALVLPLILASATMAIPPTDAQIDDLVARFEQAGAGNPDVASKRQAQGDVLKAALAELSLGDASLAQIRKLYDKRLLVGNAEMHAAVDARLATLAKQSTAEGAHAAELRVLIVLPARSAAERAERDGNVASLARTALDHPAAAELFAGDGGDALVRAIAGLSAAQLTEKHLVEALAPHIRPGLSPACVGEFAGLIKPLVSLRESLGAEKYETIRQSIVKAAEDAGTKAAQLRDKNAAARAAAPKKEGGDGDKQSKADEAAARADEGLVKRMAGVRELASGAWARGELVDHPAPAISFVWSSTEKPIHSFADLKGKVVLVDFWATWCGPCVAAFPKMRELQSRYSGYPVVILGVTSVQGYSIDRSDPKKPTKIDCKNDPAKEMDLMKSFMKDMDMTWNVAFSEQNVFNTDFGVRGIPSVAIIGPEGNVRFAGLYPNPAEESEKIDALLKEAKLPCPAVPYAEPKKPETAENASKNG